MMYLQHIDIIQDQRKCGFGKSIPIKETQIPSLLAMMLTFISNPNHSSLSEVILVIDSGNTQVNLGQKSVSFPGGYIHEERKSSNDCVQDAREKKIKNARSLSNSCPMRWYLAEFLFFQASCITGVNSNSSPFHTTTANCKASFHLWLDSKLQAQDWALLDQLFQELA